MRIAIAGAGIGGLTTALMLHRRGIRAEIYEQSVEVHGLGVGINTLPPAIQELAELNLLSELDAVGVRSRELFYLTRQGQEVWRELRGTDAGHPVPQFSIHRGRLHKVLYDAVRERLGPDAVHTGRSLSRYWQDDAGVTAYFRDTARGESGLTVRAEVLVCADGIHSVGRSAFYPAEGPPRWNGVLLWRGATKWSSWGDGRSMAISGGMAAKFVLYPIGTGTDGRPLMNWVLYAKVADASTTPPPRESWSRRATRAEVLAYARRFTVPDFDVEGLVAATADVFEYPMCDRDPLPKWSFGRITLLGDAAHPMYPVGSNGASQAILDARYLADALADSEHPGHALWTYERRRQPMTAEIVRLNRRGGPERVIDEVEERAPGGFTDIDQILSRSERAAIVDGYAVKAGFASATRRQAPSSVRGDP